MEGWLLKRKLHDDAEFFSTAQEALVDPSSSAKETMEHLWNVSHECFTINPELSRSHLEQFNDIAALHDVEKAKSVDTCLCNHCDVLLVPGINCRVRLQAGKSIQKPARRGNRKKKSLPIKKQVSLSCFHCGKRNLFDGGDPTEIKKLMQEEDQSASVSSNCHSNLVQHHQNASFKKRGQATRPEDEKKTSSVGGKVTTKSKKRKKKKSSLRALLQKDKEQQSSHSLSDFLQQL